MTTYQETNTVAGSTQEVMKVQYTAKTHTSGGRRGGVSRSDDGRLDVKLSSPPGTGTNPEQLFAAGWSACFISAMGVVANKMKVKLPAEVTVDAEIDLCNSGDVYFLRARLNVSLPGLEGEVAQAIVDATHGQTCAYLRLHKGSEAAAEFQKILDHKSASWGSAWRFPNWGLYSSISYVGLARASVLAGDQAKARKSFQDFFALWKDADQNLPILIEAKKEYAALH